MRTSGRLTYQKAWDNDKDDKTNFPNNVCKSARVTQPNGVQTTEEYVIPRLNGSEKLGVCLDKFWPQLFGYFEAVTALLTGHNNFLIGQAKTYYALTVNDPNGAYVQPHNVNRDNDQFERSLKDLWTKMFDETWLGDTSLALMRGWRLSSFKSTPNQPKCNLFVKQEARLDKCWELLTTKVHYNGGNQINEAEKKAQVKTHCPDELWEQTSKHTDLGALATAMEQCEKLDKEYAPEFNKAMKEKKNSNGKRKPDDQEEDGAPRDRPYKRRGRGGRKNRNGSGNRNGNGLGNRNGHGNQNDRRPQHNATKQAPHHGDVTVVLENGWTGKLMNCVVNPENKNFDWNAVKKYQYCKGGQDTWYCPIL